MSGDFQPPPDHLEVTGVRSGNREDLRTVAQYQKVVILCILAYLVAIVAQVVFPRELELVTGLLIVAVGIVGTVFVFLLAIKTYKPAIGVALGILTLIPCVGLIVLLIINAKSTRILRSNGIKVGILGAKLSEI
jgi:hypothetical protein